MRCTFILAILLMFSGMVMAQIDYTEMPELWSCGAMDCVYLAIMNPVTENVNEGKIALALNHSNWSTHYLTFPVFKDADWNLTNVEYLEIKVKPQKGMQLGWQNPTLYMWNRNGSTIRIQPAKDNHIFAGDTSGEWKTIRIPLKDAPGWEITRFLGPSIEHIDYFEIHFSGGGFPEGCAHHILVDGVKFGSEPLSYMPPNPDTGDLDVLIIERNPKYDRYDVTKYVRTKENPRVEIGICQNPDVKHQPDLGESVTFTAVVQNKGKRPLGGKYVWILDGKEVASGDIPDLKPREKVSYDWKWQWDPADHDLTFKIIPNGESYCTYNDQLTIRTNALMYRFMIERGALSQMETKYNMFGSRSCEDWLQGQLMYMNRLFEYSKYDFAPDGITQRVAMGKLEYVDDGEMVALGGGPYRVGETDFECDGGRGLTAYDNPWGKGSGGIHEYLNHIGSPDDAWLHELSHQIGLIDDYQFITEPTDNKVNGVGYSYLNRGIMGGGETDPHPNLGRLFSLYSPSNVQGLNVTKGKRRGYFGEYLYCMPKQSALVIYDEKGQLVTDAEIQVFQTELRVIENKPVHKGKTDSKGRFALKNRPAGRHTTETGCVLSDNPFGPIHVVGLNGVFLIIVKKDNQEMYGFTCVTEFNTAWAGGQTEKAEIPVVVKVKGDERVYLAGEYKVKH